MTDCPLPPPLNSARERRSVNRGEYEAQESVPGYARSTLRARSRSINTRRSRASEFSRIPRAPSPSLPPSTQCTLADVLTEVYSVDMKIQDGRISFVPATNPPVFSSKPRRRWETVAPVVASQTDIDEFIKQYGDSEISTVPLGPIPDGEIGSIVELGETLEQTHISPTQPSSDESSAHSWRGESPLGEALGGTPTDCYVQ